jgi:hypothetical protein
MTSVVFFSCLFFFVAMFCLFGRVAERVSGVRDISRDISDLTNALATSVDIIGGFAGQPA